MMFAGGRQQLLRLLKCLQHLLICTRSESLELLLAPDSALLQRSLSLVPAVLGSTEGWRLGFTAGQRGEGFPEMGSVSERLEQPQLLPLAGIKG